MRRVKSVKDEQRRAARDAARVELLEIVNEHRVFRPTPWTMRHINQAVSALRYLGFHKTPAGRTLLAEAGFNPERGR